jgi:hypothetical protein
MEDGPTGFIEGRVIRYLIAYCRPLDTEDGWAGSLVAQEELIQAPCLYCNRTEPLAHIGCPDWTNVLVRVKDIRQRQDRLKEAD